MTQSYAWLAPIIVAAISALSTYFIVARKASGRIATTEASKLWDEAKSLREVYKEDLAQLRLEVSVLEQEVEKLEEENRELRWKNARLERRVEELENGSRVH